MPSSHSTKAMLTHYVLLIDPVCSDSKDAFFPCWLTSYLLLHILCSAYYSQSNSNSIKLTGFGLVNKLVQDFP